MNFEQELLTIKNEQIREQCKKVLDNVCEEFYKVPASSTGKYHPEYALGEGGLYRHTCAAVKIANSIIDCKCFNFTDDDKDYIRAALILHDTCKSGKNFESKYTVHEHPLLASRLVVNVLGDGDFANNVCRLIESHMGQWNISDYSMFVLPTPRTTKEIFVHICDNLASKKFIDVHLD